ncbi:L10-interacting MYB domain-containing protein [Spatholobus suberectus]|nr:L10-interacting MYB domain-containing protein [Spatholobus suberectus]
MRQKRWLLQIILFGMTTSRHTLMRGFSEQSPVENYDQLCTILGNDQAIASFSDNVTEIDVNFAVDKGDPDLAVVSEIQTDGNQTKNLRWTVEMDNWLGKILVDQVRKGLKVDKVLQTEAYDAAVSAVNAKFGLHLTKFNIKNRLKTWKRQYELLKEILSHPGFKWDATKKMIIANDSTWNDYIWKHLDARTFRGRVFENYDQFCIIFGHSNEPLHWDESEPCDEPVEALSVCPVNYDINVKDPGRQMRWTSDMDSCLSAILVQQIKKGNRSKFDFKLKPAAFEAAVLAINEKFQLYLTKEHVKNRLKTWKKQYDILKELMDQSSFEWDEKRKMVIANDSVWNEYIKKNPDARLLKGRVIRNYDELCIIIGHCDPPDSSMNGACANMGMTTDDGVMEVQETNCHRTNYAKEKGKTMTWTDEMDHCLTELLVNQVMLGNKLEKNFKTSAYIAALTVLNERFGLNLTKENIISRLKTWKKQYGLLKEMLSQGRFEWDDGRKMVVAADLEWDEYIKKHPHARHLRDRPIENYHELGLIVGNEQGSGNWSESFERLDVNLTPNYEEHAETPALVLANVEMSHDDNASDEVQGSSEQTRARPSSSHSTQPSKRRRTGDVMLQMMSVMAADIRRIADALSESNKTLCLEEVVEKVQNMPDFDDDLIIEACEYLCFDEKRALMFLKLDERLRKKWLLKRLRGQDS